MTGRSTDRVADAEAHQSGRQHGNEPASCRQQAVDSLPLAFISFWPGFVWLPTPFDTCIPPRD
jgi:hypothetical protein